MAACAQLRTARLVLLATHGYARVGRRTTEWAMPPAAAAFVPSCAGDTCVQGHYYKERLPVNSETIAALLGSPQQSKRLRQMSVVRPRNQGILHINHFLRGMYRPTPNSLHSSSRCGRPIASEDKQSIRHGNMLAEISLPPCKLSSGIICSAITIHSPAKAIRASWKPPQ